MVEAYPLKYPLGVKRLRSKSSRFKDKSLASARDELMDELRRLGAKNIVISTNINLRRDGLPYSNQAQPQDRGVAVYFILEGKDKCFPCDKWDKVEDNIWAIAKTIENLRGIERWGSKYMVDAAFRGFEALPSPEDVTKNSINYFQGYSTKNHAKKLYLEHCKNLHPDNKETGDIEEFKEMLEQYNRLE